MRNGRGKGGKDGRGVKGRRRGRTRISIRKNGLQEQKDKK